MRTAPAEPVGQDEEDPPNRPLARWLVIGGAIGLVAAFVLTLEKLAKLADATYVPSCSINPVLSCGSIMDSPQAALFGFPNPILGLLGFPVVIVSGVAVLAGFVAPHWYRLSLLAGLTVAVVFVHWLIWVSLYEVGALCPYCMVVWAVTIPLWWYSLLDLFPLPRLRRFHSLILAGWFVLVLVLVFLRFQSFWVTLF